MPRLPLCRLGTAIALSAALLLPIGGAGPAGAVVGGTPAAHADFPFAGGFTVRDCDGTLIAPDVVLTSASCATGLLPGFDYFARGSQWHSLSTSTASRVIHPLWNGNPGSGHDLALVRLTFPAAGVPTVQVGSPWDGPFQPGAASTMLGRERPSGEFGRVDTPVLSDAQMAGIFNGWSGPVVWNAPFMIGAGTTTQTACHGDNGGPLLVRRGDRWIQAGVASFVATVPVSCARPAGFAELSGAQLAWLAATVPSITAAWGPCVAPSGAVGQTSARYVYAQLPGGAMDGPYSWEIACYDGPPPPPVPWPEADPEPEPEPEPEPDPPICRLPPWKCPDL